MAFSWNDFFDYRELTKEELEYPNLKCVQVLDSGLSCGRHADYFQFIENHQFGSIAEALCTQHFTIRLSVFKQAHINDEIEPNNVGEQKQPDPLQNVDENTTTKEKDKEVKN